MAERTVNPELVRVRRQALLASYALGALNGCYWMAYVLGWASGHWLFGYVVPPIVILLFVWWVRLDSIETGYWPAYHYGLALYAGWLIFVPHYLWKTRGPRGLMLFLLLALAFFAPEFGMVAGVVLAEMLGIGDVFDL